MKPRLDPQELTEPDVTVWAEVQLRGSPRFSATLWVRSLRDDRRDAELMLQAQWARYRTFPVDMPPLSMIGAGMVYGEIACGGALWDADPVWRHRHSTLKPLLESEPLTDEDRAANLSLALRHGVSWLAGLLCAAYDQDRRDAELMRLREHSKSDSEPYPDECWALNRRAWWPVHWGMA